MSDVPEMPENVVPQYNMLAYEMTVQLVDTVTGDRSDPLRGTPVELADIFQAAFDKHGQNPDAHVVLVLTQEVPKEDATVFIISRLPMVALPKFIQFVKEYNNV